jgi:hypothetical protein
MLTFTEFLEARSSPRTAPQPVLNLSELIANRGKRLQSSNKSGFPLRGQSRWAAKAAGRECLTFDAKGDIIVDVECIAVARTLDAVPALIRTYLFFILVSCFLRIQHS